ncbi:hypothetical protein M2419_004358 [Sphingobacterium sp. BIGb0116]|nr:hypothetical protein [Sphingobacterium sp. BIGb0116]
MIIISRKFWLFYSFTNGTFLEGLAVLEVSLIDVLRSFCMSNIDSITVMLLYPAYF